MKMSCKSEPKIATKQAQELLVQRTQKLATKQAKVEFKTDKRIARETILCFLEFIGLRFCEQKQRAFALLDFGLSLFVLRSENCRLWL